MIALAKAFDILYEAGWLHYLEDGKWLLYRGSQVKRGLTGFDVIALSKEVLKSYGRLSK